MAIIQSECSCGQPVEIRTADDSTDQFRADGKQAVYPGEDGYNIFRCRVCLQPLSETCSDFRFENTKLITDQIT